MDREEEVKGEAGRVRRDPEGAVAQAPAGPTPSAYPWGTELYYADCPTGPSKQTRVHLFRDCGGLMMSPVVWKRVDDRRFFDCEAILLPLCKRCAKRRARAVRRPPDPVEAKCTHAECGPYRDVVGCILECPLVKEYDREGDT